MGTSGSIESVAMCGIAGIIDFQGRAIDRAALERACTSLAHRGPDDRGTWVHESPGFSVGFAHTRLAIIDPTPEARQPMVDAAGRFALTYNGELYNYRALRERLGGPFHTASDTEVVLRACARLGPRALDEFDAMWALGFVDVAERTGHLSRDPFGIKPLYYVHHDRRLLFASELAALRTLGDWPTRIDPAAVDLYLHLGFIPHPLTIYQCARKLAPGHLLAFDAQGPREPMRYYRLPAPPGAPPPYEQARDEVRRRIERAVADQRVADVPLGAFLSGGVDSSIVVACLARSGGPPVKTFSIGYADHPAYDETRYARLAAGHFGTGHHAFQLTFADVLAAVEPMLDHLGEPFADSSLLPTSLVSRHTRGHVTVALSGDGGDELFGGYWRYLAQHFVERYRRVPRILRRRLIAPLVRRLPAARSSRWLNRLRQARKLLRGDAPEALGRHLAWARQLEEAPAAALLGTQRSVEVSSRLLSMWREAARELRPGTAPRAPMEEVLLADLGLGLPADMLFKVDAASMFHGLEVRVPLLGREVVEYVTGLPVEYRLAGRCGKRILKDAFRGIVPEAILDRRKMGFEVPVGEFLRRELRGMFHDLVSPGALRDFGVNPAVVERLYRLHAARREDCADLLWALLVLCGWKRRAG